MTKHAQGRYAQEFANEVPELVFVNTALRTAIQVLKEDLPMATEAKEFESRSSEVLEQCLDAINTLRYRDGEVMTKGTADYVKQIAEKRP